MASRLTAPRCRDTLETCNLFWSLGARNGRAEVKAFKPQNLIPYFVIQSWTQDISQLKGLLIRGNQPSSESCRIEDVRPSPLKPAIAWNSVEFAVVFHIWEGQASAIVWGLLSLTPSKENRNLRPHNTQGQSVNHREVCNEETMTGDTFGLEGICNEKNFATDLHNRIDTIEVSGELTVTVVDTFAHFVFPLKCHYLI